MIWSNVTTTNGTTSSTTESTTISSKSTKEKDAKESSTLDVNDFLSLLVTEMQYQDPLEPTDNSQYIAQMATFSQVEATKEMLDTATRQTASNLVGKTVIMTTDLNKDRLILQENGRLLGKLSAIRFILVLTASFMTLTT